jgi:hypothetical protein
MFFPLFATVIVDNSGKFTGGKFATGVNHISSSGGKMAFVFIKGKRSEVTKYFVSFCLQLIK